MKIALIGPSGFVGSALLKEALARGHHVTAIARNPDKIEKAPEVTRRRIYLETMAEILPRVKNKVILSEDVKGVLPLLNLMGVDGLPNGGTQCAAS